MSDRIQTITARQLIDCKCRPMVEVDVLTERGFFGRGSAPTGLSVGMYESFILRDGDPGEYHGTSVHKAVEMVKQVIAPALTGMEIADQEAIDRRMLDLDGTENKRNLGGNAIYSTSIACFRAAAASAGRPLYEHIAGGPVKTVPIPSFNMINGGKYPSYTMPFNEFILMPYRAATINEAVEIGVLVFQELERVVTQFQGSPAQVALSYGYRAPCDDPEVVLSLMKQAADRAGFGDKVAFALDCASSEMYDAESDTYLLKGERVSAEELIRYTKSLATRFPMVFIEDLLDENDWAHYPEAVQAIDNTIILGDDLIATNKARLKKSIDLHAVDGFILKPNQIGTITEAMETYRLGREHNLIAVPSGRSGGVLNDVVMDFAAGLQVPFIKNGAPRSGERIDKLNFLMRIADLNPGCRLSDLSDIVRF